MPDSNIKIETNKLLPCYCGGQPIHYSVGYGNTPLIVDCPLCHNRNWPGEYREDILIKVWNRRARHILHLNK